jgi:lysophospholipid acyltransferase (LPLAT)-like uncharacterized protein
MNSSSTQSDIVDPHRLRWHGVLFAATGFLLSHAMAATWRLRFEGVEPVLAEMKKGPVIYSMWHNRLALGMPIQRWFWARQPHQRLGAMVSASKDGAVLARYMEHFGVQPVRGSSSRRGARALLEFITWGKKGYNLVITPDGPRGPRCKVQEGVIVLAQMTGLPIVPVSARIHSKKVFGSWDAFQLPLPFSRCDVRMGEILRVPREASDAERESARRTLEQGMLDLTED